MDRRRNIVVVGTSAGGIPALQALLSGLPADLDAALLVVLHRSHGEVEVLQSILQKAGPLPVVAVHDSVPLALRHVYLAVPDRHLIVETGRLISIRSPKEDWFRPSINVLFRSAALAYGPRVVGMVLTGLLDDGAEGLRAIKARGGLVFVQDPGEAQFAMMPEAALRSVTADRVLPLQDLGKAIMDESRRDAPSDEQFPVSTELELEVQIAKQALSPDELVRAIERIGTRSMLTCPECQGTLWEVRAGRLRFRCHVGHAYSAEALATGQSRRIEDSLWSALRALEEKAQLFRRMADKFRVDAAHVAADKYERDADQLQERVTTLRTFIMGGLTDSPRKELP